MLHALILGAPPTVHMDERTPSALIMLTAGALDAPARTAALLAAADRVAASRTDLRVASIEQLGGDLHALGRCERLVRLACSVRAIRRSGPERKVPGQPRYLFVVAVGPGPEIAVRLSTMFVDMDRVVALIEATRAGTDGGLAEVEGQIFAESVRSAPVTVVPHQPGAFERYFELVFDRDLMPALRRDGHGTPLGAIDVQADVDDASVLLDGTVVGATVQGGLRIDGVRQGRRVVALQHPEHAPAEEAVQVVSGARASVSIDLQPLSGPVAQAVVLWSGVAAISAGAALVAVAAATAPDVSERCLVRASEPDASCESIGFYSAGFDAEALPATQVDAVDESQVSLAPIGLSLAVMGGTWAVGAGALEEGVPAYALGAGVAAGVVTYLVAALLAGGL